MSRSLRALATSTSWPHSSSSRLTQGELVPASMAIRSGCSEAKCRLRASGLVRSLPSSSTSALCWSMRHSGRSSCRRGPIQLSSQWFVFATIHGGPILLSLGRFRARRTFADPLRVLRGGRPSHLIFRGQQHPHSTRRGRSTRRPDRFRAPLHEEIRNGTEKPRATVGCGPL
jgi:hypothetical protein